MSSSSSPPRGRSLGRSGGDSVDDERRSEMARLGSRVRDLRLAAALTQQQVADAVGLNRVSVARLEAGRHDVGASRLAALAAVLGVDPGAFWGAD